MSLLISSLAARYRTRLREVSLFVAFGFMNTVIDFSVLNLLIWLTGHRNEPWLLLFNGLAFLAAVVNSYIFNGRFTFRQKGVGDPWLFARFLLVNAIGLAINTLVIWAVIPVLDRQFSSLIAINISKALAVLFSLCWNYVAIKCWVFKTETAPESLNVPVTQEEIALSLLGDEVPASL